jgi:glycosyltransferase involved in cell wall biosynthesis
MNDLLESERPTRTNALRTPSYRVLFASRDFRIGGWSSHALNFGRALRERGHSVGVVVPEPFGELYEEFRDNLDHVEILRRGLESRTAYLRRVIRRIVALKPDVIVNNAVPLMQTVLPFLPSEVRRVSVVHNILENEIRLALVNEPWVDHIIAVSDSISDRVRQNIQGGVRLSTIPVGLEVPNPGRLQESASIPLRLAYVGRLEGQKNLPGLVNVLGLLYQAAIPFRIDIVGTGRELPFLQRRIAGSDFAERVTFWGAQNQQGVRRLLDRCDFFLLTSHFEGTPHVVLEAMAHGLVVVASHLPGATDRIITDGIDGFLCDCNSPAEYVKVLKAFVDKPDGFSGVSGAARQTILSRYSTSVLAQRYESLFGDVSTRRRPQADVAQQLAIPAEFSAYFPGFFRQCKHRVADIWRLVAHGQGAAPVLSNRWEPVGQV